MAGPDKVLRTKSARTVNCPSCGHPAVFAPSNPYRPFCSERCRLIDLGQWATESYRIPLAQDADSEQSPDT
jgi:uncharacterized protein